MPRQAAKLLDANKSKTERLLSNKHSSHIRLHNDTSKLQEQKHPKALYSLTQTHP